MSERDETHADPPTIKVACWGCGDEVRVLVRRVEAVTLCRECKAKPVCPMCGGEGCSTCGDTGRAL